MGNIKGKVFLFFVGLVTACQPVSSPPETGEESEPRFVGIRWQWQGSYYNNDTRIKPDEPRNYTILFTPNGDVRIKADCNQVGGRYQADNHRLVIELLQTTLAACPSESRDDEFKKDLSAVQRYLFDKGELILELKYDTGGMRFSPAD
ncbi:MAG: META domain-containing protein [Proteobacteria bacterium]|jgi:heat shock protein HslJ|nr:META domain-containing protein [Pseudomonadota bacterium]MCG6934731.1 META domain-containing protein [Pseudomonadota bacterium]